MVNAVAIRCGLGWAGGGWRVDFVVRERLMDDG